jgi:hypothetical protein
MMAQQMIRARFLMSMLREMHVFTSFTNVTKVFLPLAIVRWIVHTGSLFALQMAMILPIRGG